MSSMASLTRVIFSASSSGISLNPELLLDRHDELHRVERVGAEIVDERGICCHFLLSFFTESRSTMMLLTLSHAAIQASQRWLVVGGS